MRGARGVHGAFLQAILNETHDLVEFVEEDAAAGTGVGAQLDGGTRDVCWVHDV